MARAWYDSKEFRKARVAALAAQREKIESFLAENPPRDPCPRCGVRGDIGCAHSKVPVPTLRRAR